MKDDAPVMLGLELARAVGSTVGALLSQPSRTWRRLRRSKSRNGNGLFAVYVDGVDGVDRRMGESWWRASAAAAGLD